MLRLDRPAHQKKQQRKVERRWTEDISEEVKMTEFSRLGATSLCRAPRLGQCILWSIGIYSIRLLFQEFCEQKDEDIG